MYNWEFQDWANFRYDDSILDPLILDFALETGEVKGLIESMPTPIQQETIIQFMISEAIKTSEIEGEFFSRKDVMSSIKKQLGVSDKTHQIRDKKAQGITLLMIKIRDSYQEELSESAIKSWHKLLFTGNSYINSGQYRKGTEPMQIISGAYGKEVVHFEAPPSSKVPSEMKNFIKWYNGFKVKSTDVKSILIKTAISHLYFESIHPFEDDNGRIGRAIAEKCLSESLARPVLMSLSSIIEKDKTQYYNALKSAQKTIEITDWIWYFSNLILEAQRNAKQIIIFTLNKTKFLDEHKANLNDRQLKALLKMFDAGISGFEGGMTAKKYVSINKTSRATATRDLQDLVSKEILLQMGEGRSVCYVLNL